MKKLSSLLIAAAAAASPVWAETDATAAAAAKEAGAVVTPSGLVYKSLKDGTGASPAVQGSNEDRVANWFNKSAFSIAPAYTFGNLSRNITYRGPGQANIDASIFKSFTVLEKYRGEFRAEALNLFNHPLFNNPNTNFSSASFGQITTQGNLPRSLQLGLRFSF